ncbi:hypothetical protein F4703DRAFT_1737999, partial [Phycomyces blakesleeanus]
DDVNNGSILIDIVIEWITEDNNFSHWKGGETKDTIKKTLCSEIREIMIKHGITHRSNQDICGKLQYLQNKYNDIYKFINQTG